MQIFSPKILSNENRSKNKNLKLTNEENHGKTELITAKLRGVPKKMTFRISVDCLLLLSAPPIKRYSKSHLFGTPCSLAVINSVLPWFFFIS